MTWMGRKTKRKRNPRRRQHVRHSGMRWIPAGRETEFLTGFEKSLLPIVLRDEAGGFVFFDWLLFKTMTGGGVGFQWLFHAEQAAHIGHKLLQALEEGHFLLAVHGGRRAAGRQLVEGVSQPLVDDSVSL